MAHERSDLITAIVQNSLLLPPYEMSQESGPVIDVEIFEDLKNFNLRSAASYF